MTICGLLPGLSGWVALILKESVEVSEDAVILAETSAALISVHKSVPMVLLLIANLLYPYRCYIVLAYAVTIFVQRTM